MFSEDEISVRVMFCKYISFVLMEFDDLMDMGIELDVDMNEVVFDMGIILEDMFIVIMFFEFDFEFEMEEICASALFDMFVFFWNVFLWVLLVGLVGYLCRRQCLKKLGR